MPVTPYSGKDGRVFHGATNLAATKWTATHKVADLETTNFESTGNAGNGTALYEEGGTGKQTLEGEVSAIWAVEQNPGLSPANFYAGQIVGPMVLRISKTAGIANRIYCPLIRILEMPVMNDVNGKTEYTFKWKSQGIFYMPGQGKAA